MHDDKLIPHHEPQVDYEPDSHQIRASGSWTLDRLTQLEQDWRRRTWPSNTTLTIDGQALTHMDSAGALLLQHLIDHLRKLDNDVLQVDCHPDYLRLMGLISSKHTAVHSAPQRKKHSLIYRIGHHVTAHLRGCLHYCHFIGFLAATASRLFTNRKRLVIGEIISVLESSGLNALPIIGLLSFLIGVVLAYQMGIQLEQYGANIYIVDLLALSILREFGPLITAIIIAGRTSSAFTAEIGTMKINEEIDALRTMGLMPNDLLVFPKLIGLIIATPLLTVWSDCFGLLGGMIMSKHQLGITLGDFIARTRQSVNLNSYLIGIAKAPVFAALIASVGCYQGLRIRGGALSVGVNTTKSVVQSIFLVIIADAGFSILCSELGL